MRVLFLGDVFGKPGRQLLLDKMDFLKERFQPDVIIINGENLADGKGLTEKTAKPLFDKGVDAISGGNHLWDRYKSLSYLQREPRIVKPMNYPAEAPGNLFYVIHKANLQLCLICLTGQIFMPPCDTPFTIFDKHLVEKIPPNIPILLDFHAESTAEKSNGLACKWKSLRNCGTHTHVQTADEEIMDMGTAYISDVGMTGAHDL